MKKRKRHSNKCTHFQFVERFRPEARGSFAKLQTKILAYCPPELLFSSNPVDNSATVAPDSVECHKYSYFMTRHFIKIEIASTMVMQKHGLIIY